MNDVMKRRIITAAIAAAAVVAVCGSCSEERAKVKAKIEQDVAALHKQKQNEPVPVKVITVSKSEVTTDANYVGRVEPSKSAVILNQFPGTIVELYAVKGRKVTKGTAIAKISSETLQSAYDIAKAALDQAEDGMARAEKVYGNGSVTEVQMVEIRTKLEQARAAERSAAQALEDCVIKAPFSGVVNEVYCQKGEQVSAAAPLVQILDVESVEVHFSVPEAEYAAIPVGTTASIEVPALKKVVSGTVAVKGISASPLSHAYDFTLKNISDSFSLMPGMVCKVRLKTDSEGAFTIPASAVMTDMNGRYVWSVDADDRVCKTYLSIEGYAGQGVIVSEGLQDGDRVIVEGSRKVSTGMKVKAEE